MVGDGLTISGAGSGDWGNIGDVNISTDMPDASELTDEKKPFEVTPRLKDQTNVTLSLDNGSQSVKGDQSTSNKENWLALSVGGASNSSGPEDIDAKKATVLLSTKEASELTHEEKQQVVKFLVDKVNKEVEADLIKHGHIGKYPGSSVIGNIVSNANEDSLAWKCEDCAPYLADKIENELNKYGLNEDVGVRVGLGYEKWTGEDLGHSVALVHIEEKEGDFKPETNKGEGQYDYGANISGGSFVVGDIWAKKDPRHEGLNYNTHSGFNFINDSYGWKSGIPELGKPAN